MHPRHHLLTIGAIASLGVGLMAGATPAAAGAPGAVYISLDASATVAGLPATTRLGLHGSAPTGVPSDVMVRLDRKTPAGHVATEVWTAAGQTMTCSRRVKACSISGAQLGAYGTVTLAFSATGPLRTTTLTCPKSGKPFVTTRSRVGVLTGTFRLDTHNAAYGIVRNRSTATHRVRARIPATMSRSTFGPVCPGGPRPAPCTTGYLLQSIGGATALRHGKRGYVAAQMTVPSVEPAVSIVAGAVVVGAGADLLSIGATPEPLQAATLAIPSNSFLAGTVTFTSHGPLETIAGDCTGERRPGFFDGSVTLTLPGLPATAVPTTGGTLSHLDG